jgi:DNA-binding NarL/FixJ family response regulator
MAHLIRVLVTGTSLNEIQSVAVALEKSGEVSLAGMTFLERAETSFHQLHPEAVVITYNSKTPRALEVISRISTQARVLLLGMIQDDEAADGLLAGACGVVQGNATAREKEIVDMLRTGDDDGVICPDHITYELFNRLSRLRASRTSDSCIVSTDLSFQEISILRLLGAGLSNKQIARQCNLSVHTIKNHVHWILKRLGLQNRIQAEDYFQTLSRP